MITGTAYFVSKAKAIRYYRDYEGDYAEAAVERKLAAGEIHIGAPPLKHGLERWVLLDGKTRYGIETSERLSVTRYVPTYVNKEGMRTLMRHAHGRDTFETAEAAQEWITAVIANNSVDRVCEVWGENPQFEVRPCPCYPGHFDPQTVWFDK